MMRMTCRDVNYLLRRCIHLMFVIAFFEATKATEIECDKTKCPGPLRYYADLGCTPVYKNPGDCCASSFNCDHLKSRDPKKCYVNGHEYAIGETPREEDLNPCDIGCICREDYDGIAVFNCAVVDCFLAPPKPGCYYTNSPSQCCAGPEVCLNEGEERTKCEVDGKTYLEGEHFQPASDPELNCYCMKGYKGENVEPFCAKPKRPYCDPQFRGASNIHNKCAPVYYDTQSPRESCSVFTRCQNAKDIVIHNHDEGSSKAVEDELTCKFGDLEMHLGDELNQSTDYSSVCVKCVCEVPPIPTCQRLPSDECDVTKHPDFGIP